MINGLDLFSGIGGITIGLSQWVKPICYVEIDKYAQGVLISRIKEKKLPDAPIWDDIKTFDGYPFRDVVDIIYGGFPCQDISVAGKQEGLEAKRSGLFFEIMRLAKEIRPTFIFLENVPAIRTKGLNIVGEELAYLRYDCRWGVISAYDMGAPHKRERWFLLAYADGVSERGLQKIRSKSQKCECSFAGNVRKKSDLLADTDGKRLEGWKQSETTRETFAELGRSSWWQTKPDVGRVVNELSFRVDRIKCLGNAVVPCQVTEAFRRLSGL